MYFCGTCENMMHMRLSTPSLDDDGTGSGSSAAAAKLEYHCPHCGEIKSMDSTNVDETHLVYSKDYDQTVVEVDLINEYTKYDPTLPTIRIIPCPNEGCASNDADANNRVERDILYIRYNSVDLRYVYMCRHCNTTWKSAPLSN